MENLNLVELLRDCPQGMNVDCTAYNDVTFLRIDKIQNRCYFKTGPADTFWTTCDGRINNSPFAKCVIFPKGKTTWEGFHRPFEDGDIVATKLGSVFILKNSFLADTYSCYVALNHESKFIDKERGFGYKDMCRFATEEEKHKLFQAIKDNGYRWNAETKTLEKLIEPMFKVGDRIKHKNGYFDVSILKINTDCYTAKDFTGDQVTIDFTHQDDYELAPKKFDITTLKAFDKVLVRNTNTEYWRISLFGAIVHDDRRYFMCLANSGFYQCIPYEHNEHLLGTTNDCDDFYKTWENNN